MPYGYVYQNIVHVLYCYVTTNEFHVDLASRIDQNQFLYYVLGSDCSGFVTIIGIVLGLLGTRDNAVSDTALRIIASMKRDWMQACVPSYVSLIFFDKAE